MMIVGTFSIPYMFLHENTIIFLPLCIKINERFIYVSYNGGAISHDEYQSVIELHPMFLKEYEEEDSLVDVKPLGYVKNTCRIFVSPCSVAEWELIECFSQFLEDGGILKHVNVVFPNQILEIRLPSKDVVRLKVLEKGFLPNNKECCLRLVSNTEVIISPLKRKENFYESPTLRVTPVYSDIPAFYASHLKESPVENNKPFQIALSKETYQLIPGISEFIAEYKILVIVWRVVNPSVTGDNKEVSKKIVVQLVCNDSIPLGCVAMHINLRIQLNITPLYDTVQVQLLSVTQLQQMNLSTSQMSLGIFKCLFENASPLQNVGKNQYSIGNQFRNLFHREITKNEVYQNLLFFSKKN